MNIDPLTASLGPSATNRAQETAISADFETFLVMLTAQMKNQDPLNPLDSQDFATQLATFSGVEQQVQTNDLLKALTSQFATSNLGDMAGWVGLDARMAVPGQFDGSEIELHASPPAFADRVELVVWDATGAERQRLSVPPGQDRFTWDGTDASGQTVSEGEYSFGILSYSNGELINEATPEVYQPVSEVRLVGVEQMVVLESGAIYPASLVRGLR